MAKKTSNRGRKNNARMRSTTLALPELFLIAGTRAALGLGVGFLIADRITPERRKSLSRTLIGIGALSTIPLAWRVFRKKAPQKPSHSNTSERAA